MRRGMRVTFLEFLEAICPCASDARLRLFEFWHLQLHWCQEEASIKVFKRWRKDFEKTKPASEIRKFRENLSEQDSAAFDHILTINDLMVGGVVTKEVALDV